LETLSKNTNCGLSASSHILLRIGYKQIISFICENPGLAHFNHLIFAFGKAGLFEDAARLYKEIGKAGLKSDLACHRTMMKIYRDNGRTHKGILLFEKMHDCIEPDGKIYRMDIDLYESARNIVEARYIFQLMKSKGFSYQSKFKGAIKLNTSEQMYTTCKRERFS
jgi:pentatricopeptide repeat protein